MKKNQKGFSAIETILVLVIFGLVGAAGYMVYKNHHKDMTNPVVSQSSTSGTSNKNVSDFCFQNTKAITCVDSLGKNPVKYMPPVASGGKGQLIANYGDTQYIYYYDTLFLLNEDLNTAKQLSIPGNLSINPGTISWSHDNRSLYFEILKGTNNGDRQIYKYNLADQTATQLSHGENATMPFEAADGHVIYEQFTSAGVKSKWSPYIMNANGSNAKELPATITEFASMSYDGPSDTLYIADFGTNDSGKIYYATVPAWLSTGPKTINAKGTSSSSRIYRVNNSTIEWIYSTDPHTVIDEFIDSSSGTVLNSYTNTEFGAPLGVLENVTKIQKQ